MEKVLKSFVAHVERYLGTIQGAWTRSPEGNEVDVHVLKCPARHLEDTVAFCTVGLGGHALPSRVSDKLIRQELLILAPKSFGDQNIPVILQQLAQAASRHESPYLHGEVIERTNPVFRDKPFYGFLAMVPNLLPEEFAVYTDENGNQIVFVWMVPITKAEANFVRKNGWSKLEDIFVDQDSDLIDFDRESVVKVPS